MSVWFREEIQEVSWGVSFMNNRRFLPNTGLTSLLLILFTVLGSAATPHGLVSLPVHQNSIEQLERQYQQQHEAILAVFANGPARRVYPVDMRLRLRQWQDELADSFTQARATVDEILKLNPANAELWRERRETLALYATPVGPPVARTVFGATEVKTRAKLIHAPEAVYPDEARQAEAHGEVRLRLVLAADGTVKYIFPMKSLRHGLTESAMAAARQITFTPARRDGQPVSQFATLSYEFKKGKEKSRRPYFPNHEFYF